MDGQRILQNKLMTMQAIWCYKK